MNIGKNKVKSLFESIEEEQFDFDNIQNIENPNLKIYQKVIENESNQFKFDKGFSMAKIIVDLDTKFGLKYHAENTSSFEEFIESIQKFVGEELTASDITKLQTQYNLWLRKI